MAARRLQRQRSSSAVAVAAVAAAVAVLRRRRQHGSRGSSSTGVSAAAFGDFFFLFACTQQVVCDGIIVLMEFLERNGQIRQAKLSPRVFFNQIHSDNKKIKPKKKRMMGCI